MFDIQVSHISNPGQPDSKWTNVISTASERSANMSAPLRDEHISSTHHIALGTKVQAEAEQAQRSTEHRKEMVGQLSIPLLSNSPLSISLAFLF